MPEKTSGRWQQAGWATYAAIMLFGGGIVGLVNGVWAIRYDDREADLVVAETTGGTPDGFTAIADRDGIYRIFNLPDGDFSVLGYAQGVNYGAESASVSGGEEAQVDLTINSDAPGTVTGSRCGWMQEMPVPVTAAGSFVASTPRRKRRYG